MTETGIVAIIGVLATLIGTLGGSLIASRASARQYRERRRHELHDIARRVIVETLVSARKWRDAIIEPSLKVCDSATLDEYTQVIATMVDGSETAQSVDAARDAFRAASIEARLLVSDGPLADALGALHRVHTLWWENVVGPAEESIRAGRPPQERTVLWDVNASEVSNAIEHVGNAAKASIASQL